MTRALLVVVFILVGLACGSGGMISEKPFILTDRNPIGFDQLFGNATYICTTKTESLSVSNVGLEDLEISDITFSGSPQFRLMTLSNPPITVKGRQRTYLQVSFSPRRAILYTGRIAICSNADNTAGLTDAGVTCSTSGHFPLIVGVSGLGNALPDGGGADGGMGCNCPDGGGAC
jgi:hypothetical protein